MGKKHYSKTKKKTAASVSDLQNTVNDIDHADIKYYD